MTARILVVDDVPANLRLLEARLTAEYFDVVSAASGAEALSICERAECDLVLLDVMMPDMDGFEVCRRLKSNPATHHIPVVIVTALVQPSAVETHAHGLAPSCIPQPRSQGISSLSCRGPSIVNCNVCVRHSRHAKAESMRTPLTTLLSALLLPARSATQRQGDR